MSDKEKRIKDEKKTVKTLKQKLATLDELKFYNLPEGATLKLFAGETVDEVTVSGLAIGSNDELSSVLANLKSAKHVKLEESKVSADCSAVSVPADAQIETFEINLDLTAAQSAALATCLDASAIQTLKLKQPPDGLALSRLTLTPALDMAWDPAKTNSNLTISGHVLSHPTDDDYFISLIDTPVPRAAVLEFSVKVLHATYHDV